MTIKSFIYCCTIVLLSSCITENRTKIPGDVDQVVKVIVSDILLIENNLNNNTHLKNDLGADELDLVEITIELEHQYNIILSDQDMNGFNTINDIIVCVKNKTN